MKFNSRIIVLFLSGIVLTGTSSLYAQSKRKGLKEGPSIAVSITNKKKDPPQTYFNLGLFSNIKSLNGFGFNVISSISHHYSKGIQLAGITNITGLDAAGLQISGITNVTGRTTRGIALAGLINVNGKNTDGLVVSALGNFSGEKLRGLAISGIMNISGGNSGGLMVGGLANIAAKQQKGVAIAGLMNVTGDTLRGMQITALMNITGNTCNGIQLAGIGNVAVKNRGVQTALANYAETNTGLQLGIANISADNNRGLQVGFININRDSIHARQIGCININPSTRVQMFVSGSNLNKANVGIRFKNRYTYTEFGAGAYALDFNQFSVSGFYRAGIYYPITHRMDIGADAGFYHIETLDNHTPTNECPARLYAIQPRLNLEYHITDKFGIFVSGGYSWAKQYGHSSIYRHRPSFEVGLVFF